MSREGLTSERAAELLRHHGRNELPSAQRRPVSRMVLDSVREPMVFLLVACGSVYLLLGEPHDSVLLFLSVIVVVAIGVYQDFRSSRALEALREFSSPRALVIRDGREVRVAGFEVVPGDVLIVKEGDRIAADADLFESSHLETDESLLTGESVPVRKSVSKGLTKLFSSTLVTAGQGLAVVRATGAETEVGKIGKAIAGADVEPTRLQNELKGIVRYAFTLGATFSMAVAIAYWRSTGDWPKGLLAGIAAAMSLLPEEFPVVLTVFLALGAWRLARRNVLVRRAAATENLGAVTALCVDKTGTLTLNRMSVREMRTLTSVHDLASAGPVPEEFHGIVEFGVLASHRDPFDPMEMAIRDVLESKIAETEHIHDDWNLEREYPLSAELLAMSCVWKSRQSSGFVIAAKGAPESIADLCGLGPGDRGRLVSQVRAMSEKGLRVIGVAQARFTEPPLPKVQSLFDFSLVGLLGLEDPLRPEVPAALRECRSAGVRVIMITGDHPLTAMKIAADAGLPSEGSLTGPDMRKLSDLDLNAAISKVSVFARMVPADKLRVVSALKARGEVVGMTGDGVNDAPSLRWADIGIAMGSRGTDVARESADMVLLDDNFASIVEGIRLGRRIFENIRRAMSYIFAIHVPLAGMAILPALFGFPMALFPAHIVFMELIIDPACSLVFEADREGVDVMRRPPRPVDRPLFDLRAILGSSAQGLIVLIAVFASYSWACSGGFEEGRARALAFTSMVAANLGLIFVNSGHGLNLRNRLLWTVAATAAAGLAATLLIPRARELFGFSPVQGSEILIGVATAGAATLVSAWLNRRSKSAYRES